MLAGDTANACRRHATGPRRIRPGQGGYARVKASSASNSVGRAASFGLTPSVEALTSKLYQNLKCTRSNEDPSWARVVCGHAFRPRAGTLEPAGGTMTATA